MCKHATKTERGDRIPDDFNTNEIISRLLAGHWFYIDSKPVQPVFILNMPLSHIILLIRCGMLYDCLSSRTGLTYQGSE